MGYFFNKTKNIFKKKNDNFPIYKKDWKMENHNLTENIIDLNCQKCDFLNEEKQMDSDEECQNCLKIITSCSNCKLELSKKIWDLELDKASWKTQNFLPICPLFTGFANHENEKSEIDEAINEIEKLINSLNKSEILIACKEHSEILKKYNEIMSSMTTLKN